MNDSSLAWVAVVSIAFAAIISYAIGSALGRLEMRNEAIEKEYAEYNQKTGDWQWKEKP